MQVSLQAFADDVAGRLNLFPTVAREEVKHVFAALADLVARGDSLRVPGLGLFTTKRCAAMTRPHPTTGKRVHTPEHRVPTLRPSITLRRRVWPGLRSGRRRVGK
jgi:DNA-binding protein HU-beta